MSDPIAGSFFTSDFMGRDDSSDQLYDGTLKQSPQGQLSSLYSAALSGAIQNAAAYVAFLFSAEKTAQATTLQTMVAEGKFTLSNLFGAAQTRDGSIANDSESALLLVPNPEPTLTVVIDGTSITINLSSMLDGLDTEYWTQQQVTGKTTHTVFHLREFYTEVKEPAGYSDSEWALTASSGPTAVADVKDVDDTAGVDAGEEVTGNVLGNGDTPGASVSGIQFGTGSLQGVSGPDATSIEGAYGTLNIAPDGSYTYTLKSTVDALGAEDSRSDVFTYEITKDGKTATATLTFNITGADDSPIAQNDSVSVTDTAGVDAGGTPFSSSQSVLANDSDADDSTMAVSGITFGTGVQQGVSGSDATTIEGKFVTLNIKADGTYNYLLKSTVDALAAGVEDSDVFTYEVTAGSQTTTATLTFNITGANDRPTGITFVPTLSGSGDSQGCFKAIDPDDSTLHTYMLVDSSGNPTTVQDITLDPSTGALTASKKDIVRDITVRATDQGGKYVDIAFKVYVGDNKVNSYVLSGNNNIVWANNGEDEVTGSSGSDFILGGNNVDTIRGGSGDDTIVGGPSADKLWGGDGKDTFVYLAPGDSSPGHPDVIYDWQSGEDKIDVSAIDANTAAGHQAFNFQATATPAVVAHTLTWHQTTRTIDGVANTNVTVVRGDTDGITAGAELEIIILGHYTVSASDFIGLS